MILAQHSTPFGGARAKDGSFVGPHLVAAPPQPGQQDKITLIVDETRRVQCFQS